MMAKLLPGGLVALVAILLTAPAQAHLSASASAVSVAAADCGAVPCTPVAPAGCPPAITYHHHGLRKACCGCQPPIETTLCVADPAECGCPANFLIPVCLPACCTGSPTVTSHCGLFGRGVVRYDYCCGVSVKIVFRACGDIAVHYLGA